MTQSLKNPFHNTIDILSIILDIDAGRHTKNICYLRRSIPLLNGKQWKG